MNETLLDLTVVMPALNEEKNIEAAIENTLRAFEGFSINGEIIVVNDGSTDGTSEVVKSIGEREQRVRMLIHDAPKGIGASFWDGVDCARGKVCTWIPGDNENEPREIFRYFSLLKHVDIVVPFAFNRGGRSLLRTTLSALYRFIINTTFSVNFNYTNGTALFRTSILREIKHRNEGFFFQTDILIRAAKRGYLFAEVPYRLGLRREGESKALSLTSVLKVAGGYVRLLKDVAFGSEGRMNRVFSEDSVTAARRMRGR